MGRTKQNSSDGLAAQAARRLLSLTSLRPSLGMVLGTGFAAAAKEIQVEAELPFSKLKGFAGTTVPGHQGRILIGTLGKTPVQVLSGRIHLYEGHNAEQVTFGIRLLAACGVKDVVLTNASGGIAQSLRAGDLMLITDHINLTGTNPLMGRAASPQTRFLDLTQVYDLELRLLMGRAARKCRLRLRSGVYLGVSGPTYETPAEIRAFGRLGADAVGMSTVLESVVARQCQMHVLGLSCITNLAAGRAKAALSHQEVLATAQRVQRDSVSLLRTFAQLYGSEFNRTPKRKAQT